MVFNKQPTTFLHQILKFQNGNGKNVFKLNTTLATTAATAIATGAGLITTN
jgi:hypothetical protein